MGTVLADVTVPPVVLRKPLELPVISFACPHCSKSYSVPDHQGGMRAKCRQCRSSILVPAAPPPAPRKSDAELASAGTAERAKVPTDAEFILPPAGEADAAGSTAPSESLAEQVFVVRLEFADDAGPTTAEAAELYAEARRFLADVLYAYRHRLSPPGARLTKVKVDEIERDV